MASEKEEDKNIPLVTQYMIQKVKTGKIQSIKVKNTHILLAEDNLVNQIVVTECLEKFGCTVSPAGNGFEVISEFKRKQFDLVFMDCLMPEMDGYEATGVIREWEKFRKLPATPIVAFTANAMQDDREKCLNAGMNDYVSKPVNMKSLEDILQKWLPDKIQQVELDEDEVIVKPEPDVSVAGSNLLDLSVFNTLKNMLGDAFVGLVKKHCISSKDNIKRIEKALETGDAAELEHAAHSLKGASAQFGAMTLSSVSKSMELMGQEGNIEEAKALLNDLKTAQAEVEKLMIQQVS